MRKKPTRELEALGSQAVPGASTRRSTSRSLPSLPKRGQCASSSHVGGSRQRPQDRAVLFPHSLSHGTPLLCGLHSLVTSHLLDQGCKNPASKPRRLLPLHWAVSYKILPEEQMKS